MSSADEHIPRREFFEGRVILAIPALLFAALMIFSLIAALALLLKVWTPAHGGSPEPAIKGLSVGAVIMFAGFLLWFRQLRACFVPVLAVYREGIEINELLLGGFYRRRTHLTWAEIQVDAKKAGEKQLWKIPSHYEEDLRYWMDQPDACARLASWGAEA